MRPAGGNVRQWNQHKAPLVHSGVGQYWGRCAANRGTIVEKVEIERAGCIPVGPGPPELILYLVKFSEKLVSWDACFESDSCVEEGPWFGAIHRLCFVNCAAENRGFGQEA